MAKKSNPMKKYVKIILKSERMFCQRCGDIVYMGDDISVAKMPLIYYNNFVRPLSGAFIPLEDGDRTIKDNYYSLCSVRNENGADLAKIYESVTAEKAAKMSRFLVEIPRGKKTEILRVFLCDGVHIQVKNDYIIAALEFAGEFFTNGRSIDILKWSNGDFGFILCPVTINQNQYNEFIAGGIA